MAKKREHWYARGARAGTRYLPDDLEWYICPLCLRAFPPNALEIGALTLEHVPPKALGGRQMVLTCATCNHGFSNADSEARNLEDILEFTDGALARTIPVEVSMRDVTFRATLTAVGDGIHIVNAQRANHPDTNKRLDELFSGEVDDDGVGSKRFNVRFERSAHYQSALVNWLRAAYLAVFAALGYRYICRTALQIIRDQIDNPREILISRFSMTITERQDFERRILMVERPSWLGGSILVNFGRHAVVLPGVDSGPDFYDGLASAIPNDGRFSGDISGKSPDWPKEAVYLLDI